MKKRQNASFFEYNLLVSPIERRRKMTPEMADSFFEAVLRAASRMKLEVAAGCHPYRSTSAFKKKRR